MHCGDAVATADCPAAQALQLTCPEAAYEPTRQLRQLVDKDAPEADNEVPAGQASHEATPVLDW